MAAYMCQALPSFYSDWNSKSLFISVSNDFYEKYIVTQDYSVSTQDSFCSLGNCKFNKILIGTSLSQILQRLDKYQYIYQEIDCLYTLYKHRFFFYVLSHQVGKSSISLVVECSIIYDGKEQKKHQAYQGNDFFAKSSKNII